jgi:pantothenate kinase
MKIGIDIGGSLIKLCIKDKNLTFKSYNTSDFCLFYNYLKSLISDFNLKVIGVTGGGSYKYNNVKML